MENEEDEPRLCDSPARPDPASTMFPLASSNSASKCNLGPPDGTLPKLAYPTEAHERQNIQEKRRKEEGIEAKRLQKFVGEHYGDCGDYVTPITAALAYLVSDSSDTDDEYHEPDCSLDGISSFAFWGSHALSAPRPPLQVYIATGCVGFAHVLTTAAQDNISWNSLVAR